MLRNLFRHEKMLSLSHSRRGRAAMRSPLSPEAALWCLRLLVNAGGHRRFIQPDSFGCPELAEALGLPDPDMEADSRAQVVAALASLKELHAAAEADCGAAPFPAVLETNVRQLGLVIGLAPLEQALLCLTVLLHLEHMLEEAAECLGGLTLGRLHHVLADLLGVQPAEVAQALRPEGALARSGLLTVDGTQLFPLRQKLDLISPNFAELVCAAPAEPLRFLKGRIEQAPAAVLGLQDYAHVPQVKAVLAPYLLGARATGRKGANILLYGPAGVGKTECIRVLAGEAKIGLYEVAYADEAGAPIGGQSRLRAYRAAQRFLAAQAAVLVFDEVEDVFGPRPLFMEEGSRLGGSPISKAWVNHVLETNEVPTVWVTNTIEFMDPAVLRRFDVVLQFPGPTPARRRELLETLAAGVSSAETNRALVNVAAVTPAVIKRANDVVQLIEGTGGVAAASGRDALFRTLVTEAVKAQTQSPFQLRSPPGSALYDPAFLNPGMDLTALCQGLAQSRSGRLCLYGPPGTGKTATAHWLAESIGVPVHSVRASDLLGPYVGMSERAIAQAFAQARTDGALLLIDEADSFLQERRKAERSWEVTLVNEMLTQVESFEGLLVVSTNLIDGFDQAALRRFDAKVPFGYLLPRQVEALLQRHLRALGFQAAAEASAGGAVVGGIGDGGFSLAARRLRALPNVTPGDFAAVVRRHRFAAFKDAAGFVAAVEEECALKKDGLKRAIGFTG